MAQKKETNAPNMTRRSILKLLSAGTACLGLGLYETSSATAKGAANFTPSASISINKDGKVHYWCKRTEMGQHVHVSLTQVVADELGAHIDDVILHQAITHEKYGHVATGGSGSIDGAFGRFRRMLAAAREMLVTAAANKWRVSPGVCFAEHGFVVHKASGRKLAFGDLISEAQILPVPEKPKVKSKKEYSYIGKSYGRRDTTQILTGELKYGVDINDLPDLHYVSIEHCPVKGGRLISAKVEDALNVAGVVEALEFETYVAVIATNNWAAMQGRKALQLKWDLGANQSWSSAAIEAELNEGLEETGYIIREEGVAKSDDEYKTKRSYVYEVPPTVHAPLEPVNATAWYKNGKMTVWSPCHQQTAAHNELSAALGMKKEDILVHTTIAGGSFGRKLTREYVLEAALIARKVGYPIQVVYTREDEFQFGPQRPPSKHKVTVGVDETGWPRSLDFHASTYSVVAQDVQDPTHAISDKGFDWTAALGAIDTPYSFDHLRIRHKIYDTKAMFITWWRGTYRNSNCFAMECAIDEVAEEGGFDPIDMRLKLLTKDVTVETFPNGETTVLADRVKAMFSKLRKLSNYDQPRKAGHAIGIAGHAYSESDAYSAYAIEVSIEDGEPVIHKVSVVVDCGIAVNPAAIEAQVESSVVFGLSGALQQETIYENGRAQLTNFDSVPVQRMSDHPPIEVYIMPSDAKPGGVGEPALTPLFPAFFNAVSRAADKRIRRLPLGDQLSGDVA